MHRERHQVHQRPENGAGWCGMFRQEEVLPRPGQARTWRRREWTGRSGQTSPLPSDHGHRDLAQAGEGSARPCLRAADLLRTTANQQAQGNDGENDGWSEAQLPGRCERSCGEQKQGPGTGKPNWCANNAANRIK